MLEERFARPAVDVRVTPNYHAIRTAHFRLTLKTWFKGLDKALLGLAAALTFILTAIVAMLVIGLAQALSLLQDAATDSWQRLLVVAAWQGSTFVLLRALREAAFMPRARAFFDSLPLRPEQKLRADLVLALQSYSFLWAPIAWCIASSGQPALACWSLAELTILSLCVNLALLRGARRAALLAVLALANFAAAHGTAAWVEPLRALCAVLACAALRAAHLPGAVPLRSRPRLRAFADRLALGSGLVVPLLSHELRSNLTVRLGVIAATLAACLTVIALRTSDASHASVVVFVAAIAALALYSLPALCRRTLLTKLSFLAGNPGFARRMRFSVYALPSALFAAAVLAAWPFDRSGTALRDAAVFALLYLIGVAGARASLGVVTWFMPLSCAVALIILSAML